MRFALLLIFCLLISSFCSVYGQTDNVIKYRQHTGFFLSMGIGPVFGKISSDMISPIPGKVEFSGTGAKFDLKIGGAVRENLILHATIISSAMNGPVVKTPNQSGKTSDKFSIGEVMIIGGGLTYYIMPSNIFLSGSAGLGSFTLSNPDENPIFLPITVFQCS